MVHDNNTSVNVLALIWVGILGVLFEVGEGVKLPPFLSKACKNYPRNFKFGTYVQTNI